MPWFRLDDSFHSHPKVIAAGNEAIGLYVRCGSYAAEHLTDGFIREDIAVLYGACDTGSRRNPGTGQPETLAQTLARTKLWRRTRGGWRMPDYLEYNPSKQAVENDRKLKAERQKRWRETRGRRLTNASRDASKDGSPTRPAPKEAGREGHPTRSAANGRASPPGSPAVSATPKPPWCGKCSNETTRQIGDPPKRCHDCHPLAAKETA
jgi:hypothetical protein